MAQQSSRKIMRVFVVLAALIVVAGLGVSVLWPGSSAQADNGQSIILGVLCPEGSGGGTNCATSTTTINNIGSGDGFAALAGTNGLAGLYGADTSSNAGAGVWGAGTGAGNNGVYGIGDANGVFGETFNSSASGVYGQNDATGFGVAGRADSGTGVFGDSASGVGVVANSANGTALQVTGTAQFSRSGTATVAGTTATPANSVRVSLPITSKSMMTATLQKFVAGVYVVAAVPNVSGGYFTIYLNKKVTTSVGPIAWIVTELP